VEQLTAWIATHTPIYYGPALAAFAIVYRFTADFSFSLARNALRGLVFALLLGSKFVVTPDGISPVPLWQHALTGSAGFALVALGFWTIGGFGVSQLLDAVVETLKAASKAMRKSVVGASLLIAFGAIGALATAPLGRMLDARFAPPPIEIPASALPAVIEAIAPAASSSMPATVPAATRAPTSPPASSAPTAPSNAMPATLPAPSPTSAAPTAPTGAG